MAKNRTITHFYAIYDICLINLFENIMILY